MKKYSPAPKEIAEAIKEAIPVSEKEALEEDWKKLPAGTGSKKERRASSKGRRASIPVSTETIFRNPARKEKANSFRRVRVGAFRLEVPASGDAYTDELIHLLKDFIKSHRIKA